MTRLPLVLALFVFASCKPDADPGSQSPPTSDEALEPAAEETEAPHVDEGSAEEQAAEVAEPEPEPEALDVGPDLAEDLAPPTLPSLMRQAGFERASQADLADFVHLPPGAEGEAGVFGEGERAVRIALIAYPNPRYVRPHVTDVQERIRVLPNPREAVLHHHRWVVHLMAVDRATADESARRIQAVLGWE